MTKTWILMPLANDADKNHTLKKYIDIGKHSKQRIKEALSWAQERIPTADPVWVFGAGTHIDWRHGTTLGVLSEAYLRRLIQTPVSVYSNLIDKNFYGTHEEMKWGVRAIRKRHPPGTVTFVFFGPWWHLLRARLIWSLHFKRDWGKARFVRTNDGAQCSWRHECGGYLKIIGHRLFPVWVKTRDATHYPYPETSSKKGTKN